MAGFPASGPDTTYSLLTGLGDVGSYGRMNMMMSFALLLERRWVNLVMDPIRPYFL